MAYRFDGTDDDVRFSPGALDGYTMGPVTAAALINRNATGSWEGIITILDAAGGDTAVLNDLLELDPTGHFSFWNGQVTPGSADISGATSGTLTDTTNWFVVAVSWGGASTAPRFHWKQLGAGSWTHQSISDGSGSDSPTIASADRIIIGTDPTNADDLAADVVWAGISKSNDADATIEALDTLDFADIEAYGFEWLVGFEDSATLVDRTGGGGDEVSRAGTTLVSDPTSWTWGGGGVEVFGALSVDLTDNIAVAGKKEAKTSLVVPLTANVAAASKKDAHGASAVPLTASVAVSSKKDAKAASATPLAANIASAAVKNAHGAAAVPLSVGIVSAGKKNAVATFDLPIVFDIASAGTVGGAVEGAASLAMTFGATTAGKKDAHGALALPLDVGVASSGKKDAHAALSTPLVTALAVAGRRNANATLDLPLTFLIESDGFNPGARVLSQMSLAAVARYGLALDAEAQYGLTLAAATAYALTLEAEIA